MSSKKRRRLEMTVAAIQQRWGVHALRKLQPTAATETAPHVTTSFPELDRALGIGGIPRGRITEILGAPTSGTGTLALKIVANAQHDGDLAAYIDLSHTFDADYAARCGVLPDKLLLVRPHTAYEALEIAQALIARGGIGVVVFDSVSDLLSEAGGAQVMSAILRQLTAILAHSACALVFLTVLYFGDASSQSNYPSGFALPHYASVRLLIEKEEWLMARRDIRGYRAHVAVLKNKMAAGGKETSIAITFDGVVWGNGT